MVLAGCLLLGLSGNRLGLDQAAWETGRAAGYSVGWTEQSSVAQGAGRLLSQLWPPQISLSTPVDDHAELRASSWWRRVEERETRESRINPETLEIEETRHVQRVEKERFGYLKLVAEKMLETLEIGFWGTLLAVIISLPLAVCAARNHTPHPLVRSASRFLISTLRAVPEVISALFLVIAYGFGPSAGIIALGLHAVGFLGKFFAEDMENADPGPEEALAAAGLSRFKILRLAVLPSVLPQYTAYVLYILDRNVRMATVVGLVGAGGIGQELKGRYDLFQFSHVSTVLLAILLTVLVLEQLSSIVRRRLIGETKR